MSFRPLTMWHSTGILPAQDTASNAELCSRALVRAYSSPTRLSARNVEGSEHPRLRAPPSWARLGIPRSVSDYFELYRGARAHSEGLLFAHSAPDEAFAGCRKPPRALSEGLCGGRIFLASGPTGPHGEEAAPPKARTPVGELEQGGDYEGKILRIAPAGLIIDIGAEKPGFLPRRHVHGIPRKLIQKGSVLSGLKIYTINVKRKHFSLRLRCTDHDQCLEETSYASLMTHVAGWADVSLWRSTSTAASSSDKEGGREPQTTEPQRPTRFSVPGLRSPPWPCCVNLQGRAWSSL